jgi:hypothetical protein
MRRFLLCLSWLFASCGVVPIHSAEWSIPLAGNVFRKAPDLSDRGIGRDRVSWENSADVYSVFFRVDRPSVFDVSILARANDGLSNVTIQFGEQSLQVELNGLEFASHKVGQVKVEHEGYCRLDFQNVQRSGDVFAEMEGILISSETDGLRLDYVKNNEGQMFYWGRRGPSVHLRYEVPVERDADWQVEYAYSEITVPIGYDPIGSYFMANGFGEGYFGIQVNSDSERRVLFSVWSPFATDNPKEIPPEQRIVALNHGPEVNIGEFGNEGSGGQSFLIFPWKTGATYRFLTQVKPDGKGSTVYASWFGDSSNDKWRLIAKFRRPKTDTYLVGFHSFLENFDPARGHLERKGLFGNVWVRDTSANWHECNTSHFSIDATGKGRHRLDYGGGSAGSHFFLRNGGFFDDSIAPGSVFERTKSAERAPKIDLSSLP